MTPINPVEIIQQLLDILKRRFDLLLIPAFVLIPGGFMAFKKLPKNYKSSTKIVIEEPKHSNPFLERFTISTRLKKRILLLTNIVTSHQVLGRIVDRDAKAAKKKLDPRQRHYAILGLRRKIKIMYLGQGLVQLEFACRVPKVCLDNLNFILNQFMTETLRPQKQAVTRSSEFLSKQIKRLKNTLKHTESRLMNYKQKHPLELPETYKVNLNAFIHLRKQMMKAKIKMASAERRRDFLYQKLRFSDPVLDRLKQKKTALQIKISQAQMRYTSRHPFMKRLKAKLASLRAAIRRHTPKKGRSLKEIEQFMQWGRGADAIYKEAPSGDKPARTMTPFERLQKAMIDIVVLKKKLKGYERKLSVLKQRMSAYPKREQRLEKLKREATISRNLYVKLRTLYEESLLRRELEIFDSSRRVLVVEPAVLPLFPVSPKKPIVLGGAFVASMMLSILLIAIAELSDQSVKSSREASGIFDAEVIGSFGRLPNVEL